MFTQCTVLTGGLCSLEVCVYSGHSPHWRFGVHWKFVFTQCTVLLTTGLCSLEVCVHSVHSSSHWRFVFTRYSLTGVFTCYTVLLTGGMCSLVSNVTQSVSLEEHVHMLHILPLEVCVHLLHSLSHWRCVLSF